MNGNQVYENKFENKTYNLIAKYPHLTSLEGFYYFLGDMSRSSAYNYVAYVINFLEATKKEVDNLKLDDYTKYLTSLRSSTPSYQIAVYAAMKKFSTYLAATEINPSNPMQYIKRPKFREGAETKQKREVGYLEEKEIHKMIRNAERGVGSNHSRAIQQNMEERDVLILKVFLSLGIRSAALYKLNMEDVDLEAKTLITTDKGDKVMVHYLTDDLVNAFIDWYEKREEILGDKEEDAVFISSQKRRIDQSSIYKIVKKYSAGIEGKHITPHKLRATYGTQLYKKTGDLYFVQRCMNHASPKTTEIYIRGQKNESKQKAVSIMNAIVEQ